jgi:hypothetical protein
MTDRTRSPRRSTAFLALLLAAGCGGSSAPDDPLRAGIAREAAFLRSPATAGPAWAEARRDNLALLARAERDRRAGRLPLASYRLAAVRAGLAVTSYLSRRPAAQRNDPAAFAAEWERMGGVLRADLEMPSAAALDGVEPAALRALGEAALPQVGIYYRASLDYGQSTTPDSGLYYLGTAQAQREVAAACRELSRPTPLRPPPLRPLGRELAALEAELLAAYRPPASIDRHGEFITASSILKEARELDWAGLRHGALLRYLQAVQRVAALRASQSAAPPEPAALAGRLRELATRLDEGDEDGVDHSIAHLLLERAADEVASPLPGASPVAAASVAEATASDMLPRYLAALGPASPPAPRPAPQVTVTLVRWPYT